MTDRINRLKPLPKLFFILLEFFAEEDVGITIYAKDKRDLRFIGRVREDALDELIYRCDSCTAGDEGDVRVGIGGVGVAFERAEEVEG